MKNKRFLIVGSGGRESAFAISLMKDRILYAVLSHENPTIIDCVRRSGGRYLVNNPNDPQIVLSFAKENDIAYVFVSADDPLANGVVDILLANDIKAIGGTKAATKIEWDKVYAMAMMQRVCPEFTPFHQVVSNRQTLKEAIKIFSTEKRTLVVKPQGLTGGKGVKVMPEHLKTYRGCMNYATELLAKNPDEKVLLVERLMGIEFTIMGITDGENLVLAPATYDYPFRLEGDLGPGTGGMGCFTGIEKKLPFMSEKDWYDCRYIMQKIIGELRSKGSFFNGILNGGFFKTARGIKFMEFNGRFGDPEGLNILTVLKGSFAELLENIWHKNLKSTPVDFVKKASVVKYLVAPVYPEASNEAITFTVDEEAIKAMGVDIFFAACVKTGQHSYKTLKKSRVMALGAVAEKIEDAAAMVNKAIAKYVKGALDYRPDIGMEKSLSKLKIY